MSAILLETERICCGAMLPLIQFDVFLRFIFIIARAFYLYYDTPEQVKTKLHQELNWTRKLRFKISGHVSLQHAPTITLDSLKKKYTTKKMDHWITQFRSFHCLSNLGIWAIIPCSTSSTNTVGALFYSTHACWIWDDQSFFKIYYPFLPLPQSKKWSFHCSTLYQICRDWFHVQDYTV